MDETASADLGAKVRLYRDDLAQFVGPNADKYLGLYDRQKQGKRQGVSWCWGAFFVPLGWLLYRRMTLVAACVLGVAVLLAVLFPKFTGGGWVIIPMQCKQWYLLYAQRKIAKINARATSEEERIRLLQKAGGVSIAGAVIGTVITVAPLVALVLAIPKQ